MGYFKVEINTRMVLNLCGSLSETKAKTKGVGDCIKFVPFINTVKFQK